MPYHTPMLPNQGGTGRCHLSCEFTPSACGTVQISNNPPRVPVGEGNWKSQDEAVVVSKDKGVRSLTLTTFGGSHIDPLVPGIEGQATCLIGVPLQPGTGWRGEKVLLV